MDWLQQHFNESENFPRPNWDAIYAAVDDNYKDIDQHKLWCEIAKIWMRKLKTKLPDEYSIYESDNFLLLTSQKNEYVTKLQTFLENSLKTILRTLSKIANDDGYGKYVVLIFDDIDDYYAYMSYFYPDEGEFGLSSGIYLNDGYGHFAFPFQDLMYAEPIAAHELTHALLSHLPIPLWLNEGLAVNIEDLITGFKSFRMDNEMARRHQAFWGEEEIQEFWKGDAFSRIDEGQELSYHLAQFSVQLLSQDYNHFVKFVNSAHHSDAGESAANEIYGGSLGGLLTNILGDYDWSPKPQLWKEKYSRSNRPLNWHTPSPATCCRPYRN